MRTASRQPAGLVSLKVCKSDPPVLQDFLARRLSLSRRAAKSIIDGRSVWVNRRCVWIASARIAAGDTVEIPSSATGAQARRTERRPEAKTHMRVIWQDDDYLACDKPAGRLSCDDPKSAEALLRIQENSPEIKAVHRLDRDTTGCLLFAKNRAALDAAIEVFKARKVKKIYHAVVAGRFPHKRQTIDAPIGGDPAVSHVTLETASADASLLRVHIETGRTNQIRRHLASIRHPVVGDRVFGLKSARDPRLMQVPRQMLHASTLELPHPRCPGNAIRIHSPLPADFRAALRLFGMGRR